MILKQLRLKKGFTQQKVASKLNVTKGYISQIELGKVKKIRYRLLIELFEIDCIKPKYFEELILMSKY